jgi:tRNA (mo5U34)-methyltransferase
LPLDGTATSTIGAQALFESLFVTEIMRNTMEKPKRWFHSMELPNETIAGDKPLETLKSEADIVFGYGIKDKSVLDVGAWDGYFSFEAERRGAARVLSTDHFCWSGPGWGTKAGYDYAHGKLNSNAQSIDVDVFDLEPAKLGTFDITLFLGVLYHLKDPLGGLERVAAMTNECLIIETETAQNHLDVAVMRYFLGDELNSDNTNFWAPNIKCLENMCREIGFKRFNIAPHPHARQIKKRGRIVMHAWI